MPRPPTAPEIQLLRPAVLFGLLRPVVWGLLRPAVLGLLRPAVLGLLPPAVWLRVLGLRPAAWLL
jgi:hypothetical protein